MGLTLLTGPDALARIGSAAFRSGWRSLYAGCPWATAFQHPDFVLTWYQFYGARYLPVVVFDEDGGGALSGLLTLALHPGARKLSGAGDNQAEYHGWLQSPGLDAAFILAAIGALRSAFPGADLQLRYLPPGIPLDAFQAPAILGAPLSLHAHRRPLMKLDAAAMERQRRKKNHRQNANRLGRSGEVRFERVLRHERFVEAFDEMCMQYDFRQAALYRNMPFTADPAKKPFYIELHRKGMLHVSVLRVGEAMAASHIGVSTAQRAVHLGINTHDPAFAAHSPGNLLLAMLGVHLAGENIPWLDLTPGGDRYKENFATDHDTVVELMVYGNRLRRWRNETVMTTTGLLKTGLQAAGYRPAGIMGALQKLRHPGKNGWKAVFAAWRRRPHAQPDVFRHGGPVPQVPENALAISRNRLHDVMQFDAPGASFAYRAFLSGAMQRMERSCDLYSHVRDGKLQICCWAQADSSIAGAAGSADSTAADAIVLSGLYVHRDPGAEGLVRDFLLQLLCELRRGRAGVSVYYRGALDAALGAVVQACGFAEQARRVR